MWEAETQNHGETRKHTHLMAWYDAPAKPSFIALTVAICSAVQVLGISTSAILFCWVV